MRIQGLKKYQRRHRNGCFGDLPPHVRARAFDWLARFRTRWRGKLPQWRFAILVGQAKRLALHPPSSAWGRSMLAKRGGHAVQRRYWIEGRNPTEKATRVRMLKQRAKKAEETQTSIRHMTYPWVTPPEAVAKAHRWLALTNHPNLPPPPSPEARWMHKFFDPPGCRCYYCAWPNHEP